MQRTESLQITKVWSRIIFQQIKTSHFFYSGTAPGSLIINCEQCHATKFNLTLNRASIYVHNRLPSRVSCNLSSCTTGCDLTAKSMTIVRNIEYYHNWIIDMILQTKPANRYTARVRENSSKINFLRIFSKCKLNAPITPTRGARNKISIWKQFER
jgi:hypothetical protein